MFATKKPVRNVFWEASSPLNPVAAYSPCQRMPCTKITFKQENTQKQTNKQTKNYKISCWTNRPLSLSNQTSAKYASLGTRLWAACQRFLPIVQAVSLNADCFESESWCWWIWKIKFLLHFSSIPPGGNPLSFRCGWKRARGTSILERYLRAASPPPILHPLDTNTTHLISPVHKDWPLEIWNLDSFHSLAIQRLCEAARHLHGVVDVHSPLVVVNRV